MRALGAGACAAHPRSRGENHRRRCPHPAARGSSPLTRGKPRDMSVYYYTAGLIPAHAGKTQWRSGNPQGRPAHPRSRGENASSCKNHATIPGSSPLTRGKLKPLVRVKPQGRLIPAHAGKTVSICIARRRGRAHPRSRGENPGPLSQRGDPVWLIPAHAGKTSIPHAHRHAVEAHPRSRGENGLRVPRRRRRRGSSPLTRGKHVGRRRSRRVAYGSSPLTRGKPRTDESTAPSRRLIPAHAGKTRRPRWSPR